MGAERGESQTYPSFLFINLVQDPGSWWVSLPPPPLLFLEETLTNSYKGIIYIYKGVHFISVQGVSTFNQVDHEF